MAVVTVKKSNGNFADYSVGWKKLTITSAEKGKYDNGGKFIDVFFEGYPDNFKLRVHEKHNKTTKEEFNITRLFRYCNTGIKEVAEGEKDFRVEIDIEPKHLVGCKINTYFFKDKKGYGRASENVLPAEGFENEIEKWDESKIEESKTYTLKNQILPYIPSQEEEVEDEWAPESNTSSEDDGKDPWD